MPMMQLPATILEQQPLAKQTYRIRLECPPLARAIRPGQFVMLRLRERTDPLLGRPFALYDTVLDSSGSPIGIDIVYLVVGKMTGLLPLEVTGKAIDIWGPLGKPFLPLNSPVEEVNLVAGGIGQTPFLAYARELLGFRGYGGDAARPRVKTVRLYYGVRSAELASGVDDFLSLGVDLRLASDDGTIGFHGRITELLAKETPAGPLIGCGPEPMLKRLAELAQNWNVACQVSLETPMACGIGVCFSCVAKLRTRDGGWDYKRVCVEGPVFDAADLAWD